MDPISQTLDKSTENSRLALIRNVAIVLGVLGFCGVVFRRLAVGEAVSGVFEAQLVLNTYLIYLGIRLLQQENVKYAAEQVLVCYGINFSVLCFFSGGLHGPVILLAPCLPLLAMMMSGPRLALVVAGYLVVLSLSLFGLGLSGLALTEPLLQGNALLSMTAVMSVTSIGVCSWVGWYFIQANKRLLQLTKEQGNTDYLTGLLNRRAVEALYNKEFHRAQREQYWISVILIDVDNFKSINDNYGHEVGDQCLQHVARTLASHIHRPGDVFGRYTGEEFLVVLPETDPQGAMGVAERLRSGLEREALFIDEELFLNLTASLGVCSSVSTRLTRPEDLLMEAEEMLYQCKEEGRNRVVGSIIPKYREELVTAVSLMH